MSAFKRLLPAVAAGLLGVIGLSGLYFGILSLAENPNHALAQFWEDRWIVVPMVLGFGLQVGLYVILKMRLFIPVTDLGPNGALTGASGGLSAGAMVACCAHHVTDLLPLVGFTAAVTFLAEYRLAFMILGLSTTILGILVMFTVLFRGRHKAVSRLMNGMEAS